MINKKECCSECFSPHYEGQVLKNCTNFMCQCHSPAEVSKCCGAEIRERHNIGYSWKECSRCQQEIRAELNLASQSIEEGWENGDYFDRFSIMEKSLGLEHIIAEKIANFIHYEIQTEKRKSKEQAVVEYKAELVKLLNLKRTEKPLWNDDKNRYLENIARENTFNEVLSLISPNKE